MPFADRKLVLTTHQWSQPGSLYATHCTINILIGVQLIVANNFHEVIFSCFKTLQFVFKSENSGLRNQNEETRSFDIFPKYLLKYSAKIIASWWRF